MERTEKSTDLLHHDKLNTLTLYRACVVTDGNRTDLIKICINSIMNENHIQGENKPESNERLYLYMDFNNCVISFCVSCHIVAHAYNLGRGCAIGVYSSPV